MPELPEIEARRQEAERRYNDALTDLDSALPVPAALAPNLVLYDEQLLPSLNDSWSVAPPAPQGSGIRARLRRAIWHVIAPWIQRQQAFNAHLVEHLNRNVAHHRETIGALRQMLAHAAAHEAQLTEFHTRLIVYLQQITSLVDTKGAELSAGVSALADRVRTIEAAQQEIRTTCAVLNQASQTIRREVERLSSPGNLAVTTTPEAGSATQPLESWKYVGFEDAFRGSRDTIRRQLADYVPEFAGAADVLDVGCGRGELLDLLREAGISARGLDVNHEMVEACRARGFDVVETDALAYLRSIEDGSLGGLFAGQVVEHLEPDYLMRLLDAAFHKLRPGSRIILETINPACWGAFFSSYIRDLTHVRPVHPDTLRYLLNASGFQHVEVRYRAPWPEADRMHRIHLSQEASPEARAAADTLNDNADRLNAKLFSFMDYTAVGTRL